MDTRQYPLLSRIDKPGDIRRLPGDQLAPLAAEIRRLIISTVARNGGHLASNLGVVELTIALHRCLTWPGDTLIWDVGHQVYTHKLLTGRAAAFGRLRQYGGLSGFPAPEESETDFLKTGHASTSVATALGAACAGGDGRVVAVIGDASLGGGVAFEGLNKAAASRAGVSIILNANEMGISSTTGGLALSLTRLITNPHWEAFRGHFHALVHRLPFIGAETVDIFHGLEESVKNLLGPAALFENMGLRYFGPFDGHNIDQLTEAFRKILPRPGPKLLHVVTRKGRGYPPAEADPETFHSAVPFDPASGAPLAKRPGGYVNLLSEALVDRARTDSTLVTVTAAMAAGTGLKAFAAEYPDRFFDIGIAEQAAVAFAAGLARRGRRPVVAIYATFFQRALDQLFQEICLQGLPVVFALPNSGLVGADGPTHHGVFSLSSLRYLPGLAIEAPCSYESFRQVLAGALEFRRPTVILFPRDRGPETLPPRESKAPRALVAAAGSAAEAAAAAVDRLNAAGRAIDFLPVSAIKPLDRRLRQRAAAAPLVITVEENSVIGGFGAAVLETLSETADPPPVRLIGIPDRYITFGERARLLDEIGMDEDALARRIAAALDGKTPETGG